MFLYVKKKPIKRTSQKGTKISVTNDKKETKYVEKSAKRNKSKLKNSQRVRKPSRGCENFLKTNIIQKNPVLFIRFVPFLKKFCSCKKILCIRLLLCLLLSYLYASEAFLDQTWCLFSITAYS